MKKRNAFNFLVKTAHKKYDLMSNQSYVHMTYDIREFRLVKDFNMMTESSEKKCSFIPPFPVNDYVIELNDSLSENMTTGDEYIPSSVVCPEELRFETRASAVLKAAILGFDGLYEFEKNRIPHPLTYSMIRKFAKRVV